MSTKIFNLIFEKGEEVCNQKSGTIGLLCRNGLSDRSHQSRFNGDSNNIKQFPRIFLSVEKNPFEIFDFWFNFERISKREQFIFLNQKQITKIIIRMDGVI